MEVRGALFEDDGAKASTADARREHRAIWRIIIKMDGWFMLSAQGRVIDSDGSGGDCFRFRGRSKRATRR